MRLNVRDRLRLFFTSHPFLASLILLTVLAATVAFLFWWFGSPLPSPFSLYEFKRQYPFILLAMLLGATVGAAEVASRYRDEPFLALISSPGRTYLAFNAVISLAAFCLLARYPRLFGMDREPKDFLLMGLLAGFGAMIVMRSKLFNFKNDQGDIVAVGPDAVISGLLASVDRNIDRYRSFDRQSLVFNEIAKIDRPLEAPLFIETFLASYQNLTEQEKGEFADVMLGVIEREDLTDRLKLMAIGFGLLNISGESNFTALMALLKEHQKPPPPP